MEDSLGECNLMTNNDGQPTRRRSESVIALTSTSFRLSSFVLSCETLAHENIRSDHIAVHSNIAIDIQLNRYGSGSGSG